VTLPSGAAVLAAPRCRLTGKFWHQGPAGRDLVSCPALATTDGRYHQQGEPGVWYASNREQAAWSELFRHFTAASVDPFEVRRRVGPVHCESLDVLDLTDPVVRARLELDEEDLTGDDYTICQQVATLAFQAGFDAILAPSAALPGYQTLAVFHRALGKVRSAGNDRVRQAPPRMVDLLETIRLHTDVPTSVRRVLWIIQGAGRQAMIRARRS
jgi:RES domain-containing protein